MKHELTIDLINNIPIEEILRFQKGRGEISISESGNMISMGGSFHTKYRFSPQKNIVGAFSIDMPSGKPFNYIKSFYFSDLSNKEAISKTFDWFRSYLNLDSSETNVCKDNNDVMSVIQQQAEENAKERLILKRKSEQRRKQFPRSYDKLKAYYSPAVIEYFENRCISKETLSRNGARTGILLHNNKQHKNRVFFPIKLPLSKDTFEVSGIKARNIFAKDGYIKSLNIEDTGAGLLYNPKDLVGHKTVYLCEGEIDKMSLDEAGIYNSIGNPMGTGTFSDKWDNFFEKFETINILYDFDKKNLAGLQGVMKVIKRFPEKKIKFLDLPDYLQKNFSLERDELIEEFSDINDIWVAHNRVGGEKSDFLKQINHSLISKDISELEEIYSNFLQIKHRETNKDGVFKLDFIKQVKTLDSFKVI